MGSHRTNKTPPTDLLTWADGFTLSDYCEEKLKRLIQHVSWIKKTSLIQFFSWYKPNLVKVITGSPVSSELVCCLCVCFWEMFYQLCSNHRLSSSMTSDGATLKRWHQDTLTSSRPSDSSKVQIKTQLKLLTRGEMMHKEARAGGWDRNPASWNQTCFSKSGSASKLWNIWMWPIVHQFTDLSSVCVCCFHGDEEDAEQTVCYPREDQECFWSSNTHKQTVAGWWRHRHMLMTSSLKRQRLAYDLLGESVKLLPVLPPHFRGVDVRSALIVRLWEETRRQETRRGRERRQVQTVKSEPHWSTQVSITYLPTC